LNKNAKFANVFKTSIDFFTVDEYQDISPLQQRLINAWLGSRQHLRVVGDPAQTIYSFAVQLLFWTHLHNAFQRQN